MESYIQRSPHATTFVGPDATALFAAAALRSAINLYLKAGIKVNRAYTPTAMLAAASRYTGIIYPRGNRGLTAALFDLNAWIDRTRKSLKVISKE
jgi:hypothetical protein